jgi:hypothetical protein
LSLSLGQQCTFVQITVVLRVVSLLEVQRFTLVPHLPPGDQTPTHIFSVTQSLIVVLLRLLSKTVQPIRVEVPALLPMAVHGSALFARGPGGQQEERERCFTTHHSIHNVVNIILFKLSGCCICRCWSSDHGGPKRFPW